MTKLTSAYHSGLTWIKTHALSITLVLALVHILVACVAEGPLT